MMTVGMNYRVRDGKGDAFEKKFKLVVDSMGSMQGGHLQTSLFRDTDKPARYLVVSEWETDEDFHRFIDSQTFRDVTAWGAEHILSERPTHEIFERRPLTR